MTQVRLSYEEQILNALLRAKKSERFQVIREVLQPLYQQLRDLEAELSVHTSTVIAVRYAGLLKERLHEFRAADAEPPDSKTSVRHLMWMCEQIAGHAGYVPKQWSITKLHRWVGYIQGVMTTRGFTDVVRERTEYKKLKNEVLEDVQRVNEAQGH